MLRFIAKLTGGGDTAAAALAMTLGLIAAAVSFLLIERPITQAFWAMWLVGSQATRPTGGLSTSTRV